jgi:hypothetical protein
MSRKGGTAGKLHHQYVAVLQFQNIEANWHACMQTCLYEPNAFMHDNFRGACRNIGSPRAGGSALVLNPWEGRDLV